ncbi:phosphoadenosine phosphosulfate reductase family protein [Massilia suwonensis]|uniref:Phosphoadenosine phosphosulfate reductase family protein n=1 Tax=Massilia suwonensis TaxID=648895 RepID=A0ABW0MHT8_9BURK
MDAHTKIALQFSGGRDSLALLLAMRLYWDRVTVYYTNSGDAYPETQALVDAVRGVVPHFVEIKGRVKEVHEQMGWPSDVMHPGTGFAFAKQDIDGYVQLIDRHNCCFNSIMLPMHERMKADGITLLLRGQRDEDTTKSHVKSGDIIDGVQLMFPIAHWSTDQVNKYIASQGVPLPPYYAAGLTSAPDCMRCTAWLEHGANKYLKQHHPEVASEVNKRLTKIRVVVEPFIRRLSEAQETLNDN